MAMDSRRKSELPRLLVTAAIMALFAFAVISHWSEGIEETLKNIVLLCVGFWLGSSKGSADKSEQIERLESDRPTGQPGDPVHTEEAE